ncbi:MAG: GNAT family protein [Candidatus Methanofastidiosia archaeon]|jgi:RimJ/RimL family protein N-acetyltransferase
MEYICEGKTVYLRPVKLKDAPLLVKWKKDPYIQKMTLYPHAKITIETQTHDIKRALKSDKELYLIVVIKKTDVPIGYVRVNFFEGQTDCAWLRYALGEERGKGYGKDALQCFIRYLFNKGVHRLDTEMYAFNTVAASCLESLGFVKEGVKRKAFFDGKKYVDLIVYGLLKEDFLL